MTNAYISGTGFYVPPRVVTNNDLVTQYGMETTHEWIHQRTGIEERRYADEGVGSADLGVPAAEMAIERAKINKTDIDLILFATLSPEHHFPGSGVYLQQKLGLCDAKKFVGAMDIRNQCSGFIYALSTATSFIRAGAAKNVLVVGAETHSAALDLTTRGRTVGTLFGDGAGACIVSATEEDRGVRSWVLGADGRHADVLCLKIFDIRKRPYIPLNPDGTGRIDIDVLYPYMEGKLVFRHAVERMMTSLMEVLTKEQISGDKIDLFVFHQANLRINQYIQQQLGIPDDKVVNNIMRYGNTTAATIPILLCEAEMSGKLKRGMKVACVAFGSGFTWGATIIDW